MDVHSVIFEWVALLRACEALVEGADVDNPTGNGEGPDEKPQLWWKPLEVTKGSWASGQWLSHGEYGGLSWRCIELMR